MFVDTAKVNLKAGKGGDGAVSFRHEIYIPKGGPDGGDGGKGGDIIFRADKDTNTLLDFKFSPILTAEDGKNGSGTRSAGRSGKDLIVEVPIGTCVYRNVSESASSEIIRDNGSELASEPHNDGRERSGLRKMLIADLTKDGQEAIVAKGGDGGFGNAHFKSSTRQAPIIAEVGEPGEEFEAELELKLLADVGLVGLPNAGKSTFLSVVSNAKPEIADYPFTTITPNLGMAHIDGGDLLIADIPGLIEGASEGKGLGHAFLRHVDRTAVLLHLIDVYNDDAGEAYQTIRNELDKYSDLKDRQEVIALTKCEGLDPEIIKMQEASILAKNPNAQIFTISSQAHQGLTELLRELKSRVEASSFSGIKATDAEEESVSPSEVPTISLNPSETKNTWNIERTEDGVFIVSGEKIEKFARRTDLNNYASVNRLRDIMKKLGIKSELTSLGAEPESIISIAGKEFTLVEDY
jgi:GTP-binding protein